MGRELHIVVLCLWAQSSFALNTTKPTHETREVKVLSAFNVVKFPNDVCATTTGYNGTCFTASECTSLGGSARGTCASSFGVCCIFALSCGTTTSQNNTYLEQSSYTTGLDADPCTYTVCASQSDVSKIKIDFSEFEIQGPYGITIDTHDDNIYESDLTGKCMYDQFNVVSPGHASPPTICGYNTGQHMFVPMSDQCITINIDIDTTLSTNVMARKWTMKIIQYEAGNQMSPDGNCLQYLTLDYGTIANFNYDTTASGSVAAAAFLAASTSQQYHLSNQHYDICIRRRQGYCSTCFSPYLAYAPDPTAPAVIVTESSSFGLGSSSLIAIHTAATGDVCTGVTTAALAATNPIAVVVASAAGFGDYLEIPNMVTASGTAATFNNIHRICGTIFDAEVADAAATPAVVLGTAQSTICTFSTPFKVGVHFDGHESLYGTTATPPVGAAPAASIAATENGAVAATGAGNGYSGFYLSYWQRTC